MPRVVPPFKIFTVLFTAISLFFLSGNLKAQFKDQLPTDPETIASGEAIFNSTCVICHAVDSKVIGPALKGVAERRPLDWVIKFVQNSPEMIQSGDEYANQIFNEYNQVQMPVNPISDEEVIAVFAYIQAQADGAGSAEQAGEAAAGEDFDQAMVAEGEALFKGNCTVCHAIDEQVVGPPLRDVHKRRDLPWLNAFIKNSQKVIQSGDEYAVNLYNEYSKTQMPSFQFSDEEIASVVEYIKSESAKPVGGEVVAEGTEGVAAEGEAAGPSRSLQVIVIGLVVVLVLILVVLLLIANVLKKHLEKKEDLEATELEVVTQRFDLAALVKSNGFLFIVVFFFTLVMFYKVIEGLFTIGVQQDYSPTQPIAYSHEIHAGQYQIDCNYCHTGVRKSKSANIPSANICLNCHGEIKEGAKYGTSEIAKIYAALDYDPQTKVFGPNPKPIEWVRIHNLPDLAFFNHAQHVEVGNVECETCHGEIKEMEVVGQHANLTMGWCVDCHRKTELNTKGNRYYDDLVELHATQSKKPMTVEDNGGLECAKCHY